MFSETTQKIIQRLKNTHFDYRAMQQFKRDNKELINYLQATTIKNQLSYFKRTKINI